MKQTVLEQFYADLRSANVFSQIKYDLRDQSMYYNIQELMNKIYNLSMLNKMLKILIKYEFTEKSFDSWEKPEIQIEILKSRDHNLTYHINLNQGKIIIYTPTSDTVLSELEARISVKLSLAKRLYSKLMKGIEY